MTFQESLAICFRKYVDFEGRASHSEYWWFFLFLFVTGLVTSYISSMVNILFSLVTLVPSLSAATRRLHDTGRSGWWQLLWLVPVVGWIVVVVFLVQGPKSEGSRFDMEPTA